MVRKDKGLGDIERVSWACILEEFKNGKDRDT